MPNRTNAKLMLSIRYLSMGLLVGITDLVPGVSGGTIAFVFGIWERLIASINLFSRIIRQLCRFKFSDCVTSVREVDWLLLVPFAFGLFVAIFGGAAVIGSALETNPELVRGLFLGILVGVIPLPVSEVEKWTPQLFLLITIGAVFSFALGGIPSQVTTEPPLTVIFLIAAVSICATILPGISGSFLLLIFGVYEVFIEAIRERNFSILLGFAAGSLTGLLIFSSAIRWLLARHHDRVLALLIGLMLGGLRVLWPWLTDKRGFNSWPNQDSLLGVTSVFVLGLLLTVCFNQRLLISLKRFYLDLRRQ